MANLEELTAYKALLMKYFCTDEVIGKYILNVDETLSGKELMYRKIFPYPYVPETSESAQTFICFEVNVPLVYRYVTKKLEILVYVFTAHGLMRLPDSGGMRVDVISSAVDKILNGCKEFGLGGVKLVSAEGFRPVDGYYGRIITYQVDDINIPLCEGWE